MPSLEIALEKKNFRGYTPLGVSISFELVILEIVLRPSLNYALKSNVSPMSCSGTLETLKNQVKIAHNYNQ